MNKDITNTLLFIAKQLHNTHVRWVVVGSCGLRLNNVNIQPDDIDILTDKEGHSKINALLKDYEIEPLECSISDRFDSYKNKFLIDGCTVEVMSDFKVKSQTTGLWHNVSYLLNDPQIIHLNGHAIPTVSLSQSLELYKLFNREKDLIKISNIEELLKSS